MGSFKISYFMLSIDIFVMSVWQVAFTKTWFIFVTHSISQRKQILFVFFTKTPYVFLML